MLLTLTTTYRPATDPGFLLRKRPDQHQTFDVGVGTAHVLYPEAMEKRCTAALILDIDPIALVRGRRRDGGGGEGGLLTQYVNDRPYAASSFLSVTLSRVFRSAMTGRSSLPAAFFVARGLPSGRGGVTLAPPHAAVKGSCRRGQNFSPGACGGNMWGSPEEGAGK